MLPGEVSGLKNREPMMAGVLGGDYKDKISYLTGCSTWCMMELNKLLEWHGSCSRVCQIICVKVTGASVLTNRRV